MSEYTSDAQAQFDASNAQLNTSIAKSQQARADYYADKGLPNPDTAQAKGTAPAKPQTGPADGELYIKGAGVAIGAWQSCAVSRGVLRMPSDFTVRASAKFPGEQRQPIPINSPVTIALGSKTVLTGYLERITNEIGPNSHDVVLSGRGRCCDLVDCSAVIEGQLGINSVPVGQLARQLVKPFAGPITVLTPDGDGDKKNYYFQINLSESPYEILERVCRYEGLLQYENGDGNLVLSRVGTQKHASGFTEGKNIEELTRFDSVDERFSTYIPQLMSADSMGQVGAGGNAAGSPVNDTAITRNRPKIIISEQAAAGALLAQVRATWEMLHRVGLSFRIELTCDSWTDSAGTPWTPNQIAPVSMPSIGLSVPDMVITHVVYQRDGKRGTTSRITLMPSQALTIQPQALQGIGARFDPPSTNATGPLGQPTPAVAPLSPQNAGADFNPRAGEGPGL